MDFHLKAISQWLRFNLPQAMEGFERILAEVATIIVVGFLAPLKTWILLIEFFVFVEFISERMVKHFDKSFAWYIVKAFLYIVTLMQAKGLEGALFPETPITQYLAAAILIFQFKKSMKNISEYAGVNLLEGITDTLQKLLTELIKQKNNTDKPNE